MMPNTEWIRQYLLKNKHMYSIGKENLIKYVGIRDGELFWIKFVQAQDNNKEK